MLCDVVLPRSNSFSWCFAMWFCLDLFLVVNALWCGITYIYFLQLMVCDVALPRYNLVVDALLCGIVYIYFLCLMLCDVVRYCLDLDLFIVVDALWVLLPRSISCSWCFVMWHCLDIILCYVALSTSISCSWCFVMWYCINLFLVVDASWCGIAYLFLVVVALWCGIA